MTIPSPVADVTIWDAEVIDVGNLTDYEIHLVNYTDVGRAFSRLGGRDWLAEAIVAACAIRSMG